MHFRNKRLINELYPTYPLFQVREMKSESEVNNRCSIETEWERERQDIRIEIKSFCNYNFFLANLRTEGEITKVYSLPISPLVGGEK